MKILLDPLIYWFPDDTKKEINLQYWDKVTFIVEKYFDINYLSSKYFIKLLQRLNREPFSPKKEQGELKQKIIKRIWQNLDYPNNIIDFGSESFPFPKNFQFTLNNGLNQYFSNILCYLLKNDIPCLVFLSKGNHNSQVSTMNKLYIVRHISGELNSKITELIQNGNYLKENLKSPELCNPLPFSDLCDYFFDLQNEMKKNSDEISVFEKITREVALRNRYTYDSVVTNKNNSNNHKRKIYTYNKKLYISVDFESGCFELYDYRGKHRGEISYIGEKISPRDEKGWHDIKV